MLCLWTEGPYGSGLQVKNLGRGETIHEINGQSIVPPSVFPVLVSQFVGDCSISESNNNDNRLDNVTTSQIDVGGFVKRSSKDQSRPVSLEWKPWTSKMFNNYREIRTEWYWAPPPGTPSFQDISMANHLNLL
jgi:hypothetical protein